MMLAFIPPKAPAIVVMQCNDKAAIVRAIIRLHDLLELKKPACVTLVPDNLANPLEAML